MGQGEGTSLSLKEKGTYQPRPKESDKPEWRRSSSQKEQQVQRPKGRAE